MTNDQHRIHNGDQPMYNLKDKVAVVTGAGRKGGIGAAIARQLAAGGAAVIVADLCAPPDTNLPHGGGGAWEELAAVAAKLEPAGGAGLPVRVDITDAASVQAMVALAGEKFGRLDILVNNAGAAIGPGPVAAMAEEAWRKTLEINATGTFLCCKHALPLMLDGGRGGRIINIASLAATKPKPFTSAYAASKAAVVALTRSLAHEVAEAGITVNAVLPGDVDTALKQWGLQLEVMVKGKSYAEMFAEAVAQVPLGRFALPADVAQLVAFLASDESGFITGEAYAITGGR
ncbi:MAG: SDR family NAD(P)-dependent oxidoreductase [Anaerolineae bacterium]